MIERKNQEFIASVCSIWFFFQARLVHIRDFIPKTTRTSGGYSDSIDLPIGCYCQSEIPTLWQIKTPIKKEIKAK